MTFVNYAGQRTKLPGLVGESLLQVAQRYGYKFVDGACGGGGAPQDQLHKEGQWYEPKYGEGAQCYFCHVIIPKSHYAALPPKRPDELDQLQQYPFPEDMTETCVRRPRGCASGSAAGAVQRSLRAPTGAGTSASGGARD